MRAKLISEAYDDFARHLTRHRLNKIDLNNVKYAYYWMTEGKLFDACYNPIKTSESQPYVLKNKNEMPPLPKTEFILKGTQHGGGICITVDPTYMDPCFNEDGSCLVLDFNKLLEDYRLEDLTDNREAELRSYKSIKDWPKYVIEINITVKQYMKGSRWENFMFRAINEWFPEELKSKIKPFTTHFQLLKARKLNSKLS